MDHLGLPKVKLATNGWRWCLIPDYQKPSYAQLHAHANQLLIEYIRLVERCGEYGCFDLRRPFLDAYHMGLSV